VTAKEASQRIVDSILASAGLTGPMDEDEIEIEYDAEHGEDEYELDEGVEEEASPSVVRRVEVANETF
jgi:hypothetical protein